MAKRRGLGKTGLLAACLLLCFLLCGCNENGKSAAFYAQRVMAVEGLLPLGAWYREDKAPWEEGYLEESLQRAIFGERSLSFEEIRLFLSTEGKETLELAFVTCYTYEEASAVGAILASRLRLLQKSAKESGLASLDGGFVILRGRTVLYAACEAGDKIRSSLGV